MIKNLNTHIHSHKILLVPYRKEHVLKYHGWMQNEELQELTASQPLSLEEEFLMQQSWMTDDKKCTFIILLSDVYNTSHKEIDAMVGDVNLFFNEESDEHSAELEIMIAESSCRGQGLGKDALLAMMQYGVQHLGVQHYTVKIGFDNQKSIGLFHKLQFAEVSRSEVFREVTLQLVMDETVKDWLADYTKHLQIVESAYCQCE